MQIIVIVRFIFEYERYWLILAGLMTAGKEFRMRRRIAHLDAYGRIPPVGNRNQIWVHSPSELFDEIRRRIPEVLIFSAPKPMSAHHDAATKHLIARIQRCQ